MDAALRGAVVMIVDDEEMITAAIKNDLELETPYVVLTFTSAKEARSYLETQAVDLIISDYVMPELNGIDLLIEARRLQPAATRILLTGYTDKENAIRAINEVGIYQYVEKPWDNAQLRLVIRNGLEKRFLIRNLEEKIHALDLARSDLQDVHRAIVRAFV